MPMIETDSPEVIARARQELATMAGTVRRYRHEPSLWPAAMIEAKGYLRALLDNDLVSSAMLKQLLAEMDKAVEAALNGAAAP